MTLIKTAASAALLLSLAGGPLLAENSAGGATPQASGDGAGSNASLVWCGCWGDAKERGPGYYSRPFQVAEGSCETRAMRKAFYSAMAAQSGRTATWTGACYVYESEDAILDKFERGMALMKDKGLATEWVEVKPPQD